MFNKRETAVVLAGLCALQADLDGESAAANITLAYADVFSDCDTIPALESHEIDALCEKINCDGDLDTTRCSTCGSIMMTYSETKFGKRIMKQEIKCYVCDAEWVDVYKLVNQVIL